VIEVILDESLVVFAAGEVFRAVVGILGGVIDEEEEGPV
jgi:hypothetical protein